MVRRAALLSFNSAWQLAIASSASGAFGSSGEAPTKMRNDAIASLYWRAPYCALPSQNSTESPKPLAG